jgi:hypothetical protein
MKILEQIDNLLNEAIDPRIDPALITHAQKQLKIVMKYVDQVESSLGHSWGGKYRMSELNVKYLEEAVKELVRQIKYINDQTGLKSYKKR